MRRSFLLRLGALALAFCLSSGAAQGAVEYFIKVPDIPGESRTVGHVDWIEALGFGARIDEGESARRLPGVFVAKRVDRASPKLIAASLQAKRFDEVLMDVIDTTNGDARLLYRIVLRDVLVSSIDQTHTRDFASESLVLEYRQIQWSYTPVSGSAVTAHFNKETNTGGSGPFPGASPSPTPPVDSDGDGIPDWYENANGLNPNSDDAAGDLDVDGTTNRGEFIAGTRANDPKSVFRVSGISKPDGTMVVRWNSVAGKTYQIRASANPNGPFSIVVLNVPSAGDGETEVTVPFSGAVLFFDVQTQ